MTNVMASVTEWEREIIGQRTSEAPCATQARGLMLLGGTVKLDDVLSTLASGRVRGGLHEVALSTRLGDTRTFQYVTNSPA